MLTTVLAKKIERTKKSEQFRPYYQHRTVIVENTYKIGTSVQTNNDERKQQHGG